MTSAVAEDAARGSIRLWPPELAALAKSNNAFGVDLYARIRTQKGNLAIAPVSLDTATLA